jgi:hypothetical protein
MINLSIPLGEFGKQQKETRMKGMVDIGEIRHLIQSLDFEEFDLRFGKCSDFDIMENVILRRNQNLIHTDFKIKDNFYKIWVKCSYCMPYYLYTMKMSSVLIRLKMTNLVLLREDKKKNPLIISSKELVLSFLPLKF